MVSAPTSLDATAVRDASRIERRSPSRLLEFAAVGGATLLLFPLGWLLRGVFGLDAAELAVGFLTFHAAHVINDPHFSVTYLLFYKDAKKRAFGDIYPPLQRLRYWVAGFVVPCTLIGWTIYALATGSGTTLGWMIQLMFLLVGWHYVKQGFGVLMVLSARRGVSYTPRERGVLLTHCLAGWAYAWASPADPGTEVSEKGVVYTTIAHPTGLEQLTGAVFFASAVLLGWTLFLKWRREGAVPPLGPLLGLLITVWLWTVYSSIDPLMVYLIPALHSVQYLYFVTLLKRNEARAQAKPPDFGKRTGLELGLFAISTLFLGWLFFHGAPSFLDGLLVLNDNHAELTDSLGPTPYFAALFAIVNIHHYFMDTVIWRRENPDTRYLKS